MQYELYHHGILGMKWGIRRYQNKDGSLTAAGRKRYGSSDEAVLDEQLSYEAKLENRALTRSLISKEYANKLEGESNNISQKMVDIVIEKDEQLKKDYLELKKLDKDYTRRMRYLDREALNDEKARAFCKERFGLSDAELDEWSESRITFYTYRDYLYDNDKQFVSIKKQLPRLENAVEAGARRAVDNLMTKIGDEDFKTFLGRAGDKKTVAYRLIRKQMFKTV